MRNHTRMAWQEIEGKLESNFTFSSFQKALDFVNKIGALAETANHHPDILMYDYKNVKISLYTHSKSAITQKDHELAEQIDSLSNPN